MATESWENDLHRVLQTAQREHRLPSVTAAVIRDGRRVWASGVGTLDGRDGGEPATPATQYRIASLTKTLVAAGVLKLRDAGKLRLREPVNKYLELPGLGDVTIAELLSHTGGVQAETDGPWWERSAGIDWETLAGQVGQRFEAGVRHHYSNVGYAVLGRVITEVTGLDWFRFLQTEFLTPLGMNRTTLDASSPAAAGLAVHPYADLLLEEPAHDARAMAPAGQLWSTVEDLARWASFLAGGTRGLLDAGTVAEMAVPRTVQDLPGAAWTMGHGLGVQLWNLDGRRYLGHTGSIPGFVAIMMIEPSSGDGVVACANTTGPWPALGLDLLTTFQELCPREIEPWSAKPASVEADLVGTWFWGPLPQLLRAEGDRLELGVPGTARACTFTPTGEDTWIGHHGYWAGETLRAVRDGSGRISHLDAASFRLTRTPYDPDADLPGGPGDWV